jgi:hypothetical protein
MLFIDQLIDESTMEAMVQINFYRRARISVAADGDHFEQML